MSTITVTWLPVPYGYLLTAAGSIGEVRWYRVANWPDGRTSTRPLGTGVEVYDLTVPLDGPTIIYSAVDDASVAEATVVPVPPSKPVINLPNRPDFPAVEVVVETQKSQDVAGRTVVYEVLDRNEPFVEPLPPTERRGTMVLRLEHPGGPFPNQSIDRLRKMLRTGEPMMLRTTCNGRVEDLSFIWLSWNESAFGSANEHGPDRKATVEWRAVHPIWGDDVAVSGRVWAGVPVEFATWAEVEAEVPTWQQLVDG